MTESVDRRPFGAPSSFRLRAVISFRSVLVMSLSLMSTLVFAQGRYTVTQSEMSFTSNAELELIQAASDKVVGIIEPGSNKFAFTVEVKSFEGFNSALQREHFNEKYMESHRYPRASFSGKIIEPIDYSVNKTYEVRAKGDLDIHGQKQTRIIRSKVVVQNGTLRIESNFFVPLADHNITIPSIVRQKIATEIEVSFSATLTLQ